MWVFQNVRILYDYKKRTKEQIPKMDTNNVLGYDRIDFGNVLFCIFTFKMNQSKGTVPRGLRIKPPYDRNQVKKQLRQIIDENFEEQDKTVRFCRGSYDCAYFNQDCMSNAYQRKKCYFE